MRKRILLVEDEADNMQILRDLLAPGYELDEADNGETALAAVAKQRPDLILMDIQLPIMTATRPPAASRPTRPCGRSQSLRSHPMRSAKMKSGHGPRGAMTSSPNLTVRAPYWRRSEST